MSRVDDRPVLLNVQSKRSPNIGNERQPIPDKPFAPDNDLTCPPAQVIELERNNFTSTKAKSREEQEDGVVAARRT
jgi:hypothetical protein